MEQTSRTLGVYLNDVAVGELTSEQLHKFRVETLKDWRMYAAQCLNTVNFAMRFVSRLVLAVPIAWFWLFAAIAVCDPEGLTQMVRAVVAEPEKLVEAARNSLHLVLVACFIISSIEAIMSPMTFGFVNHYKQGLSTRIRKMLNQPVEGTLVVSTKIT